MLEDTDTDDGYETAVASAPETSKPPINPAMEIFLALAATDLRSYQAAREHVHRAFSSAGLLELLSSGRLLRTIAALDMDTASAIAEQSGPQARNDEEQRYYTRAQVAAAVAMAGGKFPTPAQETSFVATSSPIYELIAAGVVEPTPDGRGVLVHVRKGIDLCLASAA